MRRAGADPRRPRRAAPAALPRRRCTRMRAPHRSPPSAAICARRATSSSTPHCSACSLAIGIGGGFGYTGQKIVVEGQSFVNSLPSYNSFNPGPVLQRRTLAPFSLDVEQIRSAVRDQNGDAVGTPWTTRRMSPRQRAGGREPTTTIKVNDPLSIGGHQRLSAGQRLRADDHGARRRGQGGLRRLRAVPPAGGPNMTSLGFVKVAGRAAGAGRDDRLLLSDATARSTARARSRRRIPASSTRVLTPQRLRGRPRHRRRHAAVGLQRSTPTGMTQLAGAADEDEGDRARSPGRRRSSRTARHDHAATGAPDAFASLAASTTIPAQGHGCSRSRSSRSPACSRRSSSRAAGSGSKAVARRGRTLTLEYGGLARGEDPDLAAAVTAVARRHAGPHSSRRDPETTQA